MNHRGKLILLSPNRVWRTYQGGLQLSRLAGDPDPADSHFPEDWIGSVTRATNIGRDDIIEGPSQVIVGVDPEPRDLRQLLASDPVYFLGERHVAAHGAAPMLLVKLLDPAIRLHFQVHPTAAFARRYLGSPSGKTEAYHILGVRPGFEPYLYLGFQRPPSREELKRMIETQDIAALAACFDQIPVRPGDTFVVPGGCPHALGEGLLLVELQEPSDLVVRFEFERGGYVLPESARFMGRGLDFCLDVFDFSPRPLTVIDQVNRCPARNVSALAQGSWGETLIDSTQTRCFGLRKLHLAEAVTQRPDACWIGIVTAGECLATVGRQTHALRRYDKFLVPAGLGEITFAPLAPANTGRPRKSARGAPAVAAPPIRAARAEILACYPPA